MAGAAKLALATSKAQPNANLRLNDIAKIADERRNAKR
jgi:hypothetical protein